MTRLFKIKWFKDILLAVCLLLAFTGLIIIPKETSDAARRGLKLCADVIIPSLFPFFVLSTLTIELGFANYIGTALEGIMSRLFRVSGPCSAAIVLGFLGGYPVGASSAISLYENGLCSKEEAERLLSFCNNSGPAFILGAVGTGILGSSKAGWLLYLTHTFASLTVGLIFRFYKPGKKPKSISGVSSVKVVKLSKAFTSSVKNSFQSVFSICAFVIFFTVIIRMLYVTGFLPGLANWLYALLSPTGIKADTIQNLLTGLIEITSGLFTLQGSPSQLLAGNMAMAAFMLGWAGLSVHCQVLSFIGESGLCAWTYVSGKLLHGVISALYIWPVMKYMGMTESINTYLAEQVSSLADLSFSLSLTITIKAILAIFLGFLLLSSFIIAKRHGKHI